MVMSDFKYEKDADGIVTITMDMQGQGANTMSTAYLPAMSGVIEKLHAEQDLKGVVFASAKKTFFAGGDLNNLLKVERADEAVFAMVERNKAPFRELEKLPVPVVAAINGAALGGGFELCLACNHRIVVDASHAVVGLPEVTLGLLPGAGGVVRLTALIGLEKALPLLLEGKQLRPADALKTGPGGRDRAHRSGPRPGRQGLDQGQPRSAHATVGPEGFKYPGGGAVAPNIRQIATLAPMLLVNKTRGLDARPREDPGYRGQFDAHGLRRRAAVRKPRTDRADGDQGSQGGHHHLLLRHAGHQGGQSAAAGGALAGQTSAVLGAGMMGSGIAWAHATKACPRC